MLKKIFFFIAIIISVEAIAQSNELKNMEKINAALKAKKEALQPFDEKDVKVDLESLGLDDVDKKQNVELPASLDLTQTEVVKKDAELPTSPNEIEISKTISKPSETITKNKEIEKNPIKKEAKDPKEAKTESAVIGNFINKIGDFLHKDKAPSEEKKGEEVKEEKVSKEDAEKKGEEVKEEKVSKEDAEKKAQEKIELKKKRELKKKIAAEKRQKIYEEEQLRKAKKLDDLRAKYMLKIKKTDQESDLENAINFADGDEEIIIPHKKNLHSFITEEPPAPPIVERFRTSDNLHIPFPMTEEERMAILFDAISSGDISFFNSAYKDVQKPNAKNEIGDTILTYAMLLQNYPVMAAILNRGANPNMPNNLGYWPISIAIELSDIKALEILANNKANLKYIDSFGRTSLMHAVRVGFLPAVELLVSRGVDVNAIDHDGFTPLAIAYRHKKEVVIKFLLKNGALAWIEKPYDPEKQSIIQELENRWKQ